MRPFIKPRRALEVILLLPAIVVLVLLLPEALGFFVGPSDDPKLLCRSPDPSPVAEANGADLVLQACAAGKTFTIRSGEMIAVDLTGSAGVDQGGDFHDFSVSDPAILAIVVAPTTMFLSSRDGVPGRFFDYFAVIEGLRSGQAMVSALLRICGNRGGCHDTNRWVVTIQVT